MRPNARKALVVIVDRRSGASEADIKSAARPLEANNVRVVPVAIGPEADQVQLSVATPEKDNLIQATKTDRPDNLGKKIMVVVLKGKSIGPCFSTSMRISTVFIATR